MNHTLPMILSRKKQNSAFPATEIKAMAVKAIKSPPPLPGDHYPDEKRIVSAHAPTDGRPYFFGETVAALSFAFIGLSIAILVPMYFGLTNGTILAMFIGGIFTALGIYGAFFKSYPRSIDASDIAKSHEQLNESGDKARYLPSLPFEAVSISLCACDGFLLGSAVAERAGQTIFSPRMAIVVGVVLGLAITVALYKLIESAAREAIEQKTRKAVRQLEDHDPSQAEKMKKRVGLELDHAYGTAADSNKKRYTLAATVIFIVIISFVIRLVSIEETTTQPSQAVSTIFVKE